MGYGPTIRTFLDACFEEFHAERGISMRIREAFMTCIAARDVNAAAVRAAARVVAFVAERGSHECALLRISEEAFRLDGDGCTPEWVDAFCHAASAVVCNPAPASVANATRQMDTEFIMFRLATMIEQRFLLWDIVYHPVMRTRVRLDPIPGVHDSGGVTEDEATELRDVTDYAMRKLNEADAQLFTLLTNIPVRVHDGSIVEPFTEDELLAAGFPTKQEWHRT